MKTIQHTMLIVLKHIKLKTSMCLNLQCNLIQKNKHWNIIRDLVKSMNGLTIVEIYE